MVRFDENDVENKYGFTRKMTKIWELVENDQTLEDADFIPTAEDVEYYRICKLESDLVNEGNTGKRKKIIRYFND